MRRGVGVEVEIVLALHNLDFLFAVSLIDEPARRVDDYRQAVVPLGIVCLEEPDQ